MQKLQDEGVPRVSLGLMPFSLDAHAEPFESTQLRKALDFMFRRSKIYNYKGIHFTKTRFGGQLTSTFLSHQSRTPLLDGLRILRLAGIY